MLTFSVMVFLLVSFSTSSAYRRYYFGRNFTVGGLFNEHQSDRELAFKYTTDWYNLFGHESAAYNAVSQKITDNNIFSSTKIMCNMTKNNRLIAVFGPEGLGTGGMTESLCNKLQLPHIQTSWRSSYEYPAAISLNFFPFIDLLADGFATILKHMNWKSYAVIYQYDDALIRLQGILKIASVPKNPVYVKQLERGSEHRPMFKLLKSLRISNIVLDCHAKDILNILRQAKEINLLNYPSSYLLTSLDAHTVDYSSLGSFENIANITIVRLFDPSNENLVRHVQSWELGEMGTTYSARARLKKVRTEAVLMVDAVNMLIETVNTISKNKSIEPRTLTCEGRDIWETGQEIVAHMRKQKVENSLTGPIAFDQFGRRVNFTVQVFELSSNLLKATWSPADGDNLHITITAEERKQLVLQSLQKQRIIISTKITQPYLMHANGNQSEYEGYTKDLMDLLAQELNFTYEFYLNTANGNYDENLRKWTGVIGDVVSGEAQLGICDLTVTLQRRQVVDFSAHFMTLGISILYKKPSMGAKNMFAFIEPLSEDVWMYTATAYLGISVLLYLTARLTPRDWENPNPLNENPEELTNVWSLSNALWVNMGSLMTVGCDIMPKGMPSRMIVVMWWFFSLLITNSYTANMAAYLARGRMRPSINSVEDLIAQNKIKYGAYINGSTYEFFRKSNYSTYQAVWKKMISFKPSTFVGSNEEGVRKALNKHHDYAYFMESASLEYEVNKHCELMEIGHWLDSKGYGIAMPIDAPYRGEINNAILKFQESGDLQAIKNKWWKENNIENVCAEDMEDQPNDESLNLSNVGGVFLVLGVGVLISFLVALMEFLWEVYRMSVEEKISYWKALAVEFKFAVNLWITKKATKAKIKQMPESQEPSEIRSIAAGVIQGGSPLLNVDAILRMSNP